MRVYAMDKETRLKRNKIHTTDQQESQKMFENKVNRSVFEEQEHQDRSKKLDIKSRSINMHKEDDTKKDINHIQFHR